jgi:hypothetical protein
MPGVQPDIAERLQVDVERARRVAGGVVQFARRMEEASLERASAYVLAGSCCSVLDVEDATAAFRAAAADYALLGRSFGAVVRICGLSADIESPRRAGSVETNGEEGEIGVEDALYGLLATHWLTASGSEAQAESRDIFGYLSENPTGMSMPIGRLGLPLHRFLTVSASLEMPTALAAVGAAPERRAGAIADGLIGFLERAQEPYSAAMADQYHWSRIQSGLLPVEPEVLAVSVIASATRPPS